MLAQSWQLTRNESEPRPVIALYCKGYVECYNKAFQRAVIASCLFLAVASVQSRQCLEGLEETQHYRASLCIAG
jgi:hypothetical protein